MKKLYSMFFTPLVMLVALKSPSAADIDVLRGAQSETMATSPDMAGAGVTVLRGTPTKNDASYPTPQTTRDSAVEENVSIASGSHLWSLHRPSGGLVACWLQGTGYVGGQQIRCISR